MKKLITILLLFYSLTLFSQKQGNIWYFGDHAGVDFSSGIPVALTNGSTYNTQSHSEGSSTIADSSGSLLFYTNGEKLWNRNHQVMPDGNGLLGNFSSTQSSVIVPKPGSSRFFYVFTVDDYFMSILQYGFRYSVVDICLDNGFGDVVEAQKNILLIDTVAEKVAVVKHSNGIDYWIITHKGYSDAFYTFLLTSNGISDTIITQIGSNYLGFQGQLKVSPNGNTIAMGASASTNNLDLFDFDKSNGIISNHRELERPYSSTAGIYGVEFSPDNSKLYGFYYLGFSGLGIVQYDLNAGGGNLTSINNSMNLIYDNPNVGTIRALQLGPDGKIYMASINHYYLCVIHNPNDYGSLCNFQEDVIYLDGMLSNNGLPTFITNYEYTNTSYNCITEVERLNITEQILIFPNPTTGKIRINAERIEKIEVFDIHGKELYKGKVNEIDLSQEPDGIYIINVITDKQAITRKLIKQ